MMGVRFRNCWGEISNYHVNLIYPSFSWSHTVDVLLTVAVTGVKYPHMQNVTSFFPLSAFLTLLRWGWSIEAGQLGGGILKRRRRCHGRWRPRNTAATSSSGSYLSPCWLLPIARQQLNRLFLPDPGIHGAQSIGLDVTHSPCSDLTDVTLADEDTNSILTDDAKMGIMGDVAMHVAPTRGKFFDYYAFSSNSSN